MSNYGLFLAGVTFGISIFWLLNVYSTHFIASKKTQFPVLAPDLYGRISGLLKHGHARLTSNSAVTSADQKLNIPESNCETVKKQRNEVSMLLNQKLQLLAQMKCESGADTSEGGAYCPKGKTAHATDSGLAEFLKKFFAGKKIGSFGEGLGHYKEILTPFCAVYDGYDGAPYTQNVTDGKVKFLDLSVPQYGLPMYDIVISMEVAEHIPKEFEQTYLDNLARYADEGIILSWARPGQGGYRHVNNRPLEYVLKQMAARGFYRNMDISDKLRNVSTLPWLRKNLNIYYRMRKRMLNSSGRKGRAATHCEYCSG